jgi:hypothetical protein
VNCCQHETAQRLADIVACRGQPRDAGRRRDPKVVTQDLGTLEANQETVTWSADQPGREENMVHIANTR